LITAILTKVTEVTKYVTMTQHCMTACVTVISVDYWESLSKKEQEIFRQAAELAMVENREVNARMKQSLPKIGISIADYAKQENLEVIELTPEERNRFREAMVPVWNKYRKKLGDEIFDFMLERIEANHQ
jgi:TRAP-type C4-dicarboxylate transport system substrate-binding protein